MHMDAITMLKDDHKRVKQLFRDFEKSGARAQRTRAKIVENIIKELSVHAAVEEQVFYPAVKGVSEELTKHVLESLEEHHVAKWLLSELDGMDPSDERFEAKVTVLIESIKHHVEEEETEFFPDVRKCFTRSELADLAEVMEKAKKLAPTRPHPRAADEPPGNVVSGLLSGFVDRVRDRARENERTARRKAS
jgi:hemerythrin superfamily protein